MGLDNKKAIVTEYLPWILIALALLAIMILTIAILREKGISLIDSLKNIFTTNRG